jgi:hypothetical protein
MPTLVMSTALRFQVTDRSQLAGVKLPDYQECGYQYGSIFNTYVGIFAQQLRQRLHEQSWLLV